MKVLTVELLERFLEAAVNELSGEWLLVGGTLLPAVGLQVRSTVDIDLIGLSDKERVQNLELMDLADRLGLSIESINQAAAFFLKQTEYKKSDLLILRKGRRAVIYRPSFELYLKLKSERLTEADILDLQHYFNFCLGRGDVVHEDKCEKWVTGLMKKEKIPERRERLKSLRNFLTRS